MHNLIIYTYSLKYNMHKILITYQTVSLVLVIHGFGSTGHSTLHFKISLTTTEFQKNSNVHRPNNKVTAQKSCRTLCKNKDIRSLVFGAIKLTKNDFLQRFLR